MVYDTFIHLVGEEQVKITIHDKIVDGKVYYYGRVINLADSTYQNLTEFEKSNVYGMSISGVEGKTVIYSDPERLKTDLIEKYGTEPLTTEHYFPNILL